MTRLQNHRPAARPWRPRSILKQFQPLTIPYEIFLLGIVALPRNNDNDNDNNNDNKLPKLPVSLSCGKLLRHGLEDPEKKKELKRIAT